MTRPQRVVEGLFENALIGVQQYRYPHANSERLRVSSLLLHLFANRVDNDGNLLGVCERVRHAESQAVRERSGAVGERGSAAETPHRRQVFVGTSQECVLERPALAGKVKRLVGFHGPAIDLHQVTHPRHALLVGVPERSGLFCLAAADLELGVALNGRSGL